MAVAHASLGLVGLVFLAGSLVMLFFVILSAVTATSPLQDTYFLRANTAGISGARDITQWTYFYICGDGNTNCSPAHAAPGLGLAWDGNPAVAPPADFLGSYGGGTTSRYYWYMWRFGWVLYIISLFFEVLAFFTGFVACCGRLGSAVAGLAALVALFFYTVAVSLMTATFVKMRDVFLANGRDAQVGKYAFGFSWGAWTALLIAAVLFLLGARGSSGSGSGSRFGSLGRRSRSTRSRKSVEMGGRRQVKDEYS